MLQLMANQAKAIEPNAPADTLAKTVSRAREQLRHAVLPTGGQDPRDDSAGDAAH